MEWLQAMFGKLVAAFRNPSPENAPSSGSEMVKNTGLDLVLKPPASTREAVDRIAHHGKMAGDHAKALASHEQGETPPAQAQDPKIVLGQRNALQSKFNRTASRGRAKARFNSRSRER